MLSLVSALVLFVAVVVMVMQKRPSDESFVATIDDKVITTDLNGNLSTVSIYDLAFPSKTILMWNDKGKDTVPPVGWLLCDGTLGTPDLRYRFPVGLDSADSDFNTLSKNSSQDNDAVQLTVEQIPSHKHSYTTLQRDDSFANADNGSTISCPFNNDWSDEFTTESAGDDKHHNNMPPYIVVKFIMKQ